MWFHLFGLTMINATRPYFRKHILNSLEAHEMFFMNMLFISGVVGIYFIYAFLFEKHIIHKTYKNCCKLTYTQLSALAVLAVFAVSSSILILDADKNFNTPSINYIIIKSISMIVLFLIGYFLFEEKYDIRQILGIIFVIIGITILLVNPL